ncbi:MAG: 50S ribosomal protein L15 [Myxococcota bacterium]|nr:50S ribosomal protein L15 [Myxococcales bacterium]MEC7751334.1 50S ribosomal protein L15 [Myxococcota bacterium]|tara:strand:+ start:231 stop:725 length:495 start_codon:yes stop_codon:yes gene_type:complete
MSQLKPNAGSRSSRRRVGRGSGSGHGKTSGRGHKGQKSRKSGHVRRGFEGGQMPLIRRLAKRGFNNKWRTEVDVVNVGSLAAAKFQAGSEVNLAALAAAGLIPKLVPQNRRQDGETTVDFVSRRPVKLLGNGTIDVALTVSVHRCSKNAQAAIEAAGGTINLLS